jgi:hypothetical protein
MTTADGQISGTTAIPNNGSPYQHWNIAILGDGYTQNEISKYSNNVQDLTNHL